jgi:Fungal fucose-specific lectin
MEGQVSATSWVENGPYLRVYRSDDDAITERAYDGSGWYNGAFSAPGVTVGATSWLEGGQIYIRVYVGNGSERPITEHCWDGNGWYVGAFQANGAGASAVSWFDSQVHIRVYVRDINNKVTEHGWDGNGWYTGAYTD